MIIGNNNSFNNNMNNMSNMNNLNNYNKQINQTKKEPMKTNNQIPQGNTIIHANVTSKNEMHNKAYAMLEERYNNGLISLEEFTKKCNHLNKQK